MEQSRPSAPFTHAAGIILALIGGGLLGRIGTASSSELEAARSRTVELERELILAQIEHDEMRGQRNIFRSMLETEDRPLAPYCARE